MTETSYWWTTGSTGDGVNTYARGDLSIISKILAACTGAEGVAPSYANTLTPSVYAANTLRIASGAALVDGKPYQNSANVDVTIPSASTPGNTRIDRVVLRADWTAQTVRLLRIAGTEAVNPSAPAITQISETTYDIKIAQARVDTSGNLTVTDERDVASNEFSIVYVIGDLLNDVSAGLHGYIELPFAGILKQATIVANQAGSAVVDIWKDSYANFPPTDADSITASAPLALVSSQKQQDPNLTGWAKTFAAGEWMAFNVDSASGIQQLTIALRGKKL